MPSPPPVFHTEAGVASWYGAAFHGKPTSSGEIFNMYERTAAHLTAPFGTIIRVVNLRSGKSTVVRINDRGPFVDGRIIDLSWQAARDINLLAEGLHQVRLEFLGEPPNRTKLYVQAGAFRERANAKRQVELLSKLHPDISIHLKRRGGISRIWIGPIPNEDKVADLIGTLCDEEIDAFVVRQ